MAKACNAIDGTPKIGKVSVEGDEGDDVSRGFDGAFEAEEERHPSEVEGELRRINGHGMLGRLNRFCRGKGGEARGSGAIGRVAHYAVVASSAASRLYDIFICSTRMNTRRGRSRQGQRPMAVAAEEVVSWPCIFSACPKLEKKQQPSRVMLATLVLDENVLA